MKRLEDHMSSKAKKPAVRAFAKPGRDKVFVTETVHSKEAAINAKMRSVEPKLLGVKLVNYRQTGMRKVWVPCYFMIYDFNVKRNVFFKSNTFHRIDNVEQCESYMTQMKCMLHIMTL